MKWLRTNLQHNITIPLSLLPIPILPNSILPNSILPNSILPNSILPIPRTAVPRPTVPKTKSILKPIIIINHIVYTKGCHCLEDDVHAADEESNQFFIFMLNIPQKHSSK